MAKGVISTKAVPKALRELNAAALIKAVSPGLAISKEPAAAQDKRAKRYWQKRSSVTR